MKQANSNKTTRYLLFLRKMSLKLELLGIF